MLFFQGGNTLGMEESHHSVEVVTVDQHAEDRWRADRETLVLEQEQPVVRTSERVVGEDEDETDFTSILLPVDSKERRVLLRRSGVAEIDTSEKEECRDLRVSRQTCGCECGLYCLPECCPCISDNIKCQVDRLGFPCGCTAESCLNKAGRLEFNPVKVRTHFVRTIMRTRLEAARYLPTGTLGYLAHSLYSHQEVASTPTTSSEVSHWVPGSWWTFSANQGQVEDAGDDVQEDSGSSDSDDELYAEVVEEEEVEGGEVTLVTDDQGDANTQSEIDVLDILDDLIQSVIPDDPVQEVEEDEFHDEGISSDSCTNHTDTEPEKSEEDSSDRSEGFGDDTSEDKTEYIEGSERCQCGGSESLLLSA